MRSITTAFAPFRPADLPIRWLFFASGLGVIQVVSLAGYLVAEEPLITLPVAVVAWHMPSAVQSKLTKLQSTLAAQSSVQVKTGRAAILNEIAETYLEVTAFREVSAYTDQALEAARAEHNSHEEIAALNQRATLYGLMGQDPKALEIFQQMLRRSENEKDDRGMVVALSGLGWMSLETGQPRKSLEFQNQSLSLATTLKDTQLAARALLRIAHVYAYFGDWRQVLSFANDALSHFVQAEDRGGQADSLIQLESAYLTSGDPHMAARCFSQSIQIAREIGDRRIEATDLRSIGNFASGIGQKREAIEYYQQAMKIYQEVGDLSGLGGMLTLFASLCSSVGDKQKALEFYGKALKIARTVESPNREARVLISLGAIYSDTGEEKTAIEQETQGLEIFRREENRGGEASALANMAHTYEIFGELQNAMEYYAKSAAIWREMDSPAGQAAALLNQGGISSDLGLRKNALNYYGQALDLYRKTGGKGGEARTLHNIGIVYRDLGDYQRSLDFYRQALTIYEKRLDIFSEANVLVDIAVIYNNRGESQKALDFAMRALPIVHAGGDRNAESGTLEAIGSIYWRLAKTDKAADYYDQALALALQLGRPLREARIFGHLVRLLQTSQPSIAIFYGKEAVNRIQRVRENIREIDKELQASFVGSRRGYYHSLANLLIDQGRLPEAQQVLDLLKKQEYNSYIRGAKAETLAPVMLTSAESQADEDYRRSTAQVISLGEHWSLLKKVALRTPDQEREFQQLSDELGIASKALNEYYSRLYVIFGQNSEANRKVGGMESDTAALRQQIAAMPNTVALYTLITEDRYRVIVISGATMVARQYLIAEKDLNHAVLAFQQALHNPGSDPKPLAQQLYRILIGPVKADLDQAHAQTLVWALDGVLRYIPIAALHDGQHYLVEDYDMVEFTPESLPHLSEKPGMDNASAVAMGISQKYDENLTALPAVIDELNHVVHDPQVAGANGVLPGSVLLNDKFTQTAMERELNGQHAIVHIASHFVLTPGDDDRSYLLLAGKDTEGGGYHFTVASFRDDPRLSLDATELLTLSACDTGLSSNAGNGREVDGLAITAQLKGARAVISSLWAVNDSSTGALMADFYKRWVESSGKLTKVEALRQAQLQLLSGRIKPESGLPDPSNSLSFSHPYYWAPFILAGNWR
jgi:CHAT domain-containing protein